MKRFTITPEILLTWGMILTMVGACILFGVTIYDAFQISLERGLKVTGWLLLLAGIALASLLHIYKK